MTNSSYDPIPDLAQLIDGLGTAAATGSSIQIMIQLGALLVGPYARLRGGLLLDEPAWDAPTTEEALRAILHPNQEKRS
jgi:hypothetical protein